MDQNKKILASIFWNLNESCDGSTGDSHSVHLSREEAMILKALIRTQVTDHELMKFDAERDLDDEELLG